jgi:hypothetical protein
MVKIYNFNMCVLLGLDFNTKIEVENPETVENASTTIQSFITTSYADRAEFKAQDYRLKAADYQV